MRLTKRLMAMLLMVCMVLSMLPAIALTASAANITSGFMTAPAGTYSKVTDFSTLNTTDTYIIVFGTSAAMSTTQNSNNRSSVSVTVSNNSVTLAASNTVQAIKLVSSGDSSFPWKLNTVSSGVGYLYAPSYNSGTGNYLRTSDTASQAGSNWSISASDIHSTGSGTRRFMKLNGSLVSCYATGSNYPTADLYKLNTSAASHTVTASVSPSSAGSVALGATSVAENGTTTATATANTGYTFSSWSISGTGASLSSTTANPTTITMGTANVTVTANFTAKTQATLTYSENGSTHNHSGTHYVGDSITLADPNSSTSNGKTFVGWLPSTYALSDTAPTGLLAAGDSYTLSATTNTLYAVYATVEGSGNASTTTDELTVDSLGVTATAYASGTFSNKSVSSDAKYAGQVIKGGSSPAYIQFRGTSPGGIVTTMSGGTAKSITVTWAGSNTNGRILNIYGSNTAYTDGASIYSGTPVGTITFATGDTTGTYTFTDDYEYIGIRPSTGTAYCSEIDIVWQSGTPSTYSGYTTAPQAQANPTYTVSVTSGITGGSVSASPATAEEGDTITVTATPNTGYELTALTYTPAGGSATNISTSTKTFTMPAANVTVNATFSEINYTITTSAGANGSITAAATANYQDTVNFTVSPDSGYQIASLTVTQTSGGAAVSYTDNGNGSYTISSFPAANVTIAATFSALPTYSYTIYSNSVVVDSGTAASVTAPTAPASIQYTDPDTLTTSTFTFAGWAVQDSTITTPGAYSGNTLYQEGETIPLSANNTVIRAIFGNGAGFKLSYTYQGTEYFAGAKGSGSYLDASTDSADAVLFGMDQYNSTEYYYLYYTVNGDKYYLTGSTSTTLTISSANSVPTSGYFLWKETESSGSYTYTSYNTSYSAGRPLGFNNSTKDRFASYNADNTLTKASAGGYLTEAGANYYAVTYVENAGSDTVTNMPSGTAVQQGQSYTIPNTTPVRAHYAFTGWNDGTAVRQPGYTYSNVTAAITLTAQWQAVSPTTVTFYSEDGNTVLKSATDYYPGETPTAPADPTKANSGLHYYEFAGWARSAGGTVESPITAITSGESSRSYYAVFTEHTATFTLSFTGRTKVSTEGSFVSTVLTPALTSSPSGFEAAVTGLTINSGSNDSIATVSTTGNVLTVTGVSAGSLTLNVTAAYAGGTATGTVTVTVIAGSGGASGGYTLITKDNTFSDSSEVDNYDWTGEYIVAARRNGTAANINKLEIMTFSWTDATTVSIIDGAANHTEFDLTSVTPDDFGVASQTSGSVTMTALHTGEGDYVEGATTTADGMVYDRITGFTDGSDNDITDQYVLVFDRVDEINNYYTIRIKGTNYYFTNSSTGSSGNNAVGGEASPTSIGSDLMWHLSWASNVDAINGLSSVTPDMILIESVTALNSNVSRALLFNQGSPMFRVYGGGAYSNQLNNAGSGYNVFLYGKTNPFEAEIIYNDVERNTTTSKIEVPYTYKQETGSDTITLEGMLDPESYPGWTILDNGVPAWSLIGAYDSLDNPISTSTSIEAISGTQNATFHVADWTAANRGYYYVVKINYRVQDPDGVIHDVPQQAMIVVRDGNKTFQTVINEASSLDHTGSWTVPSRVGTSGVDLNAFVRDNFGTDYSQRSAPEGYTVIQPASWTYTSQRGYSFYAIDANGVVTWNPNSVLKDDVLVITATAGLTYTDPNTEEVTTATVVAGTFTLYVNKLAYTGDVVASPDDTVTEIPFASTAFAVTLGNFKNNNDQAPGSETYSINSASEWNWSASTLNGTVVPVTKTATGATLDVTGLATGTQVIVRATNVIATSNTTTGVHTVVTVRGKTFTIGEDNRMAAVDDSFVLDFDRNAVLNVMANDRNATGATISAIGGTNASMAAIGTGANAGKITFTVPGGQLTTASYTFTYTLTKSGETDSTATVTVKPASAIYYEDTNTDFFTYTDGTKGKWSVVGTDNAWTQSAIDTNDESAVGYDEGANSLTWSAGVTHKANVGKDTSYGTSGASETWPNMQFSFVGNAFTLSMMRNNYTGLIAVYVDGTKVSNVATSYGAIGSGAYDSERDYGGFIYDSSDSNYGMPTFYWKDSSGVARSHTVKVQVLYSASYDHKEPKAGNYDVYIDGVTIYNPITGSTVYNYISFRDTVLASGSLGIPSVQAHDYAATLSPASISVATGHTGALQLSLTDANVTVYSGYTVAYTSSDTSIATVTSEGSLNTTTGVNTATVTGVSAGQVTITATITTPGGTTLTRTATVNVSDTAYTVTYKLPNGDQEVTYATEQITLGSGVTHLTAAELAEYNAHPYVFRGWVPATVADTATQPATLRDDGASVTLSGDATYYAVYTYGTTDSDFLLKTDLDNALVDGETILIYETEGAANADKYVLSNEDYGDTGWQLNYRSGVEAIPVNGIITKTNTSLYWDVVATTGGFYLKDQSGKYLSAADTDGHLVMVTTPDSKAVWNTTTTGVTGANSVFIYNNESSPKYIQHYSGYPEFCAYIYDAAYANKNEMQIFVQQENNLIYTTDLQSTTVRYTVNYYVDGTAIDSEQVVEGANPSFPNVTGAYTELAGYSHDYTFLGWIPAAIAEDTTTQPATIYNSGDTYAVNDVTAFYAVFTYTGAGSAAAGYSLSDSAPEAGDTFIIAANVDGTYYALNHSRGTTALSLTDGAVADTTNVLWKLTAKTNGDYVQTDEETGTDAFKLNSSSTNYNGISDVTTSSNTGAMSFAANGDGFDMYGTYNTGRHLGLSASGSSVQSSAQTLYIFKYSSTGGSATYYATTLGEAAPITHSYEASITPTSLALHVGETGSVSATLTDNGATVSGATPTYTTSMSSVATVAADGTVTAVANGNATITATYTVDGTDYTATCSVAVTTLATYNVTYMVNGSQYGETESVVQGNSPSFTAPSYDVSSYTAHNYEFLGWKEGSALSADTTETQTLYVAGNTRVISGNTTYYAVYRYTEGGGALTEAIDLGSGASGQYVIAANVGGTYYAMSNTFAAKISGTSITNPGSSISSSDATNYVVTITNTSDGFTISNGTNLLGYPSSGTDFTTDTHPYWSITTGTHGSYRVANTDTTSRAITYRAGSTNKFAPYATSNINGTEYYDVEIIPVGDSSSATYYATTLNVAAAHSYVASISPTSVTIEAGQETTAIGTLTDNGITTTAYTPTYTSSNTGVATVSSIGYVDAISAGTANITVSYDVDGTTYSAVCAVTVTPATVVTSYTVSYYVNGNLFETETVAENGHPEFDAPTTDISAYDAQDYTFAGWAANTVSNATTAPTMYTASTASSYTVTGDVTFHAVYTWSEGGSGSGSGSGNYELVSASEATAGSYVIGALRSSSATNAYYFATGTVGSGDMNTTSSSVTVSGTSIAPSSLPTGTMVFTFSGDNSNGFTIATSDGDYLGYTSASNRKLAFASSYSSTKWTVADKSGSLNSKGTYLSCKTGTYTISENSTATGAIRGYANTTVYRAIYLFKLNSSGSGSGSGSTNYYTTTLAAGDGETATLSVSPSSMSLSTGGYGQIAVTAANGGANAYVTATSSNTSVATVYALNDGNNSFGVSAGSAGSATITIRYFDSSANQLASQTVSVTVTAASGTGGTNADYGRVGSDGNAPTTSGSTNAGTRGVVATSISQKAADYYTAKGVTWADLTALSGVYTNSSVTAASGNALKSQLDSLMNLTNTVTYSSLTTYWPNTDKSNGSSQNLYIYSNVTSNSSVSREHVWPKSRGQFYESGAGSDLQHLRPEESTVNSTRGNHTMGYVNGVISGCSTKTYGGNTVLWYSGSYSSNDCSGLVEVMDCCKGDVARILLYVYTAYPENTNLFTKTSGGGSGNNASDGNKVIESLNTLLEWCALDPVDTWEMSRNDAVQTIQGNRNVYIDYPELAWMIFNLTPPTTMQTPSGQAAAGNVGTRNSANYYTSAVNNSAVMSAEPAPATRGGATRAIGDENTNLPVTGAVMLDGIGQISNNEDVMNYLNSYGAKNCLVVPANGSVVFYLTGGSSESMISIGASALNGTGTTLKVYQISAVSGSSATGTVLLEQPLATSTEMYYRIKGIAWTGDKSNVLMVRNEGSAPMLLTNLRSVSGLVEGHISTGGEESSSLNGQSATRGMTRSAGNELQMVIDSSAILAGIAGVQSINEGSFDDETPVTPVDPVDPVESDIVLRGNSISLNGQIDVNFYLDISDELFDDGVYATIDGVKVDFTEGQYGTMVSKKLPAKEMNTKVTLKLYAADGTPLTFKSGSSTVSESRYSVQDYLTYVIAHPETYGEDLVKLCKAMSDYGSYTQRELGFDVENAKNIYLADEIANITCEGYGYEFTPNTANISFLGASVVTESETAIRVYFSLKGEGFTATVDGEPAAIQTNERGTFVEIANISAKNLCDPHTIVVTNGNETVTISNCSAYSYVQSVLNYAGASDSLKLAVKALKLYGDLAAEYFNK